MSKVRLEAFSDGVLAIIITIMVLELRPPHEDSLHVLRALWPVGLSYVLSFIYLGVYWNNHHHLFQAVRHIDGGILWANLHLLLWLSLVPFGTAWMGETDFAATPVAAYGTVLLLCAVAYTVLVRALIREPANAGVQEAIGRDMKGSASLGIYVVALMVAFVLPWAACALYLVVAILWIIPDRRISRTLARSHSA
ncbi:MAG: TMEM175 family protein [Tepidiformaceae bacterium]